MDSSQVPVAIWHEYQTTSPRGDLPEENLINTWSAV